LVQDQKLQQTKIEFQEDMEDKYKVELAGVPLKDYASRIPDLHKCDRQNVRRFCLDTAKLKHF
jgi:hypothetical protein